MDLITRLRGVCSLVLSMIVTTASLFAPIKVWTQESHIETEFHLVLDIDWTLANPTNEKMAKADSNGIIIIDGNYYRLSKKALEVLITLHQMPDVKVSFFSGGEASRNLKLINQVYRQIHRKLGHDEYQAHRILNIEHMREVSKDKTLKFSQKRKKDLSPYFDVLWTLLADDVQEFSYRGQKQNMIWTGETYNDRVRYELQSLEDTNEKAYTAPNEIEWNRDQNKLIRILGIFLEARDRSHMRKIPLVSAAQTVLRDERLKSFDPLARASKEKLFDPASCGARF